MRDITLSRYPRRPRFSRAEIVGAVLLSGALVWLGLVAVSLAH
jgi:hypothetical protein